jgi:hypothetical protein
MKYTIAMLLGLGAMIGASAQAAPRLTEPALKSETAAPAQKVQYGPYWGYGYYRPWYRHRYYRPYWGYGRPWGYGPPWGYGWPY